MRFYATNSVSWLARQSGGEVFLSELIIKYTTTYVCAEEVLYLVYIILHTPDPY